MSESNSERAIAQRLEGLFDQRIAERLGVPIEEVRENMGKCQCCWSEEFRKRYLNAIRESGGNPALSSVHPRRSEIWIQG
jgi:hypothetical protein